MSLERKVSHQPTEALSYDPDEPVYWDLSALERETQRVFEVCHGCRMCFKFCDSFPALFGFIDQQHDGDTASLTAQETAQVMGDCFQCKLCEVQCPYTPRDGHEFQIDFPRLVHRYRALHTKGRRRGITARVLADPDASARAARASFGLANWMNRARLPRWLLEKLLGIHRLKLLPEFAATTFERWAEGRGLCNVEGRPEVLLFQTCYVQNNEPAIGRDTVEVLEHNRVRLACAKGLRCCGMPAWEQGDLTTLRANAAANLRILMPFVEQGAKVLAINPTCSMMMRREWPQLLEGDDRARAGRLAGAVMGPAEYLWSIREEDRFNTNFRSTPGRHVAYHVPCHLRAQAVGFRSRDLLRKIPGVVPVLTMECCGHDGTHAMTVRGYEPSIRIGRKAFEGMADAGATVWATDCPLAALQFRQHAGVSPMHPMTILARAYRDNGFPEHLKASVEQEGNEE